MKRYPVILLSILLAGALLLSACNIPGTKSPSPLEQTQVFLSAQATLTQVAMGTQLAASPTPTNTAVPPTATNTVQPSATNTSVTPSATSNPPTVTTAAGTPIRLSMTSGGTNLSVNGKVEADGKVRYVFGALKGQLIDFSISSANYIIMALQTASGQVIVPASNEWTWYRSYLPADGDYYLDILPNPHGGYYSFYLAIPERLSFAAGKDSLTATGTLGPSQTHNYIFWGAKGQTLKVSVGPGTSIALSVWGVDGTVLISRMGTVQQFEGVLPASGDYIIDVFTAADSGTVNYSMPFQVK